MAKKIWTIQTPAGAHIVEMDAGGSSGFRSIRIDGEAIALPTSLTPLDSKRSHRFLVDGVEVEVTAQPYGFGRWYYRLRAGEDWQDAPLPQSVTPVWSLPFVLLAALPTFKLFEGGAPPLAMGLAGLLAVGGSLAVLANARDPIQTAESKMMRCGVLVAIVWACILAPSAMMLFAIRILNPQG